jgi:hypothetical protein
MAHDVFISYASEDKTVADAVCAMLESHAVRCWIAPRDVLPGMAYGEAIIDAIRGCRVMVLVFSSKCNTSPHIPKEIERAVSSGVAVLPFRIEDVMPGRSLDYFIGSVHWLDALTPPLERHVERLAHNVQTLLSQHISSSDGGGSRGVLKYYIYISDAKVNMLLPQVPHDTKKRIATKFNLDLKLLGAPEAETLADRIARLEAVVSFVREFGKVGTVDHPDEYVGDSLAMRWGPYREAGTLMYFGGATDSTIVGLGGSDWHVLGNNRGTSNADSGSITPYVLKRLYKELDLDPAEAALVQQAQAEEVQAQALANAIQYERSSGIERKAVVLATLRMKGPLQKLEFLSKRLMYVRASQAGDPAVLLATPLYVAMLD